MNEHPDVTLRWLGAAHFHLSWGTTRVVIDPLYTRLPGEKPVLEAAREDVERVDYLLLTHGHLDHSADFPYLLGAHSPVAYAPEEVLTALRKQNQPADWSRCHSLESVNGQAREIGDVELTPYQIGTEQIDFWFIRSMFVRPWRHGRPQAVPFGIRWMLHHLFCNCFAFHFRFHAGNTTLLFFGNLPPEVDQLGGIDRVDVLAIPYCPANNNWKQQSLALIERFSPRVTSVHHFDNFMHPFTHSRYMDLGSYQTTIRERFPDARLFFSRFGQDVALEEITSTS